MSENSLSDQELLSRFSEIAESPTFFRECVPGLLKCNISALKVLYLNALNDPEYRKRVEEIYLHKTTKPKIYILGPESSPVSVGEFDAASVRENEENLLVSRGYIRK
jgi:hypothetical protein